MSSEAAPPPPPPAAAEAEKKGGLPVVRIVLFGVLAIVLILGGLDLLAKNNANATAEAWESRFQEAQTDKTEIPLSEFVDAASGSPSESAGKTFPNWQTKVFTWGQLFGQDLEIHVTVSKDDKQVVKSVTPQWE